MHSSLRGSVHFPTPSVIVFLLPLAVLAKLLARVIVSSFTYFTLYIAAKNMAPAFLQQKMLPCMLRIIRSIPVSEKLHTYPSPYPSQSKCWVRGGVCAHAHAIPQIPILIKIITLFLFSFTSKTSFKASTNVCSVERISCAMQYVFDFGGPYRSNHGNYKH